MWCILYKLKKKKKKKIIVVIVIVIVIIVVVIFIIMINILFTEQSVSLYTETLMIMDWLSLGAW